MASGTQPSTESEITHNPPKPEVVQHVTFPTPSPRDITFDPHGDVTLVIPSGNDPSAMERFRVNSGVLCLASPVFRVMLGPHSRFREGINLKLATIEGSLVNSSSTSMELQLADDDPSALAVVLQILHLQFDKIPIAMLPSGVDEETYQLYEMAIICDKYDMKQVLLYWFQIWTTPRFKALCFKNIAMSTVTGSRWLFIAYAFGHSDVFHRSEERRVGKECVP